MLDRQKHPVASIDEAEKNSRTICQPRGYCGPFLNEHVYNDFPDPLWHGMGECVHCRNTVLTASEHDKRRRRDKGAAA